MGGDDNAEEGDDEEMIMPTPPPARMRKEAERLYCHVAGKAKGRIPY